MSIEVGRTINILGGESLALPGGIDYQIYKVVGGSVTLFSAGHEPTEITEIPVYRDVNDKGNQVLHAQTEATVRISDIDWDGDSRARAKRRATGVVKKTKPKPKPVEEVEAPAPKKLTIKKAAPKKGKKNGN